MAVASHLPRPNRFRQCDGPATVDALDFQLWYRRAHFPWFDALHLGMCRTYANLQASDSICDRVPLVLVEEWAGAGTPKRLKRDWDPTVTPSPQIYRCPVCQARHTAHLPGKIVYVAKRIVTHVPEQETE